MFRRGRIVRRTTRRIAWRSSWLVTSAIIIIALIALVLLCRMVR